MVNMRLASGGERLRIAGTELFVRETGDGPPVLLINGMGAHHGMWEPLMNGLPTFRTIAFDAPGIGLSPPRSEPMSIQALARLCGALIDTLGHPRVDIIGYSFGGTVAQQLARTAPERVRRMVLVNTSCGWGASRALPGRSPLWRRRCATTRARTTKPPPVYSQGGKPSATASSCAAPPNSACATRPRYPGTPLSGRRLPAGAASPGCIM